MKGAFSRLIFLIIPGFNLFQNLPNKWQMKESMKHTRTRLFHPLRPHRILLQRLSLKFDWGKSWLHFHVQHWGWLRWTSCDLQRKKNQFYGIGARDFQPKKIKIKDEFTGSNVDFFWRQRFIRSIDSNYFGLNGPLCHMSKKNTCRLERVGFAHFICHIVVFNSFPPFTLSLPKTM